MKPTTEIRYGPPAPADIASKLGKEILRTIIDGELPRAPISKSMSFWITEVGDGFTAFEGEPGRHLLNPMGGVYGGWALTLIDSAGGCAGHFLLPAGSDYTTIETKADFARPITRTPADAGRCPRLSDHLKRSKGSRP